MNSKLEEIIKASEKLFMRHGIKSVSMDDIATELTVSKKTLYKYISDKHKLVKLVLEHALKRRRMHDVDCKKGENAVDEYLLVYKTIMDIIRQANFSVEYDLQKYYPDLHQIVVEARKAKMQDSLRLNLQRGISEGLYRPEIEIDVLVLMNTLLSEAMHNYEFLTENRDQLIHIMKVNFDYHMRAIVTTKGLEEYLRLKNKLENLL